jgi:HEAT repeat protein
MRFARVILALTAGLLLAATNSLLAQGNPGPADDKTTLDESLKQLASYDFGGNGAPLSAISKLTAASYGKPEQRMELAAKLATLLQSAAPYGAKDFVCRQLALIGTANEVPALAGLLADEKLSHMARYALERIPGPAADEALRAALSQTQGKTLVGVINSLGDRRSEIAVADLAALLSQSDPMIAGAAATSLGKIGPAAAQPLQQALASVSPAVRPAVADGCLLCAEALLAQGKREEAVAVYDRVRSAEVPAAARVAATRGAILARQTGGVSLLVEQLKGNDPRLFAVALSLVRQCPGTETTAALAAELAKLPPEKQVALLSALADRADKAATPAVLRLVKEGDATVRPTAIQTLGKLGDAALAPVLLEAASGDDPATAQAALACLAGLADPNTDRVLLAMLEKVQGKARCTVIELLGQRRVAEAASALLKAAGEADASIRLAAIKALGETATLADLPALVQLAVKAGAPADLAAAEAALGMAAQRMPDREACAEGAASAMAQAGVANKVALLRVLVQIGGTKALAAVQSTAKDGNETVRDAAMRALADWQDLAAAPELLNQAKTSDNRKYKILALRGYIRLIGQRSLPADQKLAMCREAMPLAERSEEKRLVLGALGGVPTPEGLAMVSPSLDDPTLKNEASAAAVAIGEKIAGARPAEVAEAMKKVLAVTENPDLKKRAETLLGKVGKK